MSRLLVRLPRAEDEPIEVYGLPGEASKPGDGRRWCVMWDGLQADPPGEVGVVDQVPGEVAVVEARIP